MPARHHCSMPWVTTLKMEPALTTSPLNTFALRWSQILWHTRRTNESNALRCALGIRLRAASHQSTMHACCVGVSSCHPNFCRVLNQTSLLTTQETIKLSFDSVSRSQRAQRLLLSKPCRCRRSAVQTRSWITSQRKNLNSLGAMAFQISFAPLSAVWHKERAEYAEFVE
jgi:hypothetical protein